MASAQSPVPGSGADDIVVTPGRSPQEIQRVGSAITVVRREDLERTNPASLVDALRSVPGLDVTETGGPGATTSVRLRGANAGQTLVLIDGVRVNDPSGVANDFDFAVIAPGLIDRIEVLRGPQSAVYGSDAIGGVVNIITRRGRGPFQGYAQIEGGSYGSVSGNAGAFGSNGPWQYAFAAQAQRSDGFSRFGFRIGRIERTLPPLEDDGFARHAGYARVGFDPGTGFRFEAGGLLSYTFLDYDASFGRFPDTPSGSAQRFTNAYAKGSFDLFDGRLTQSVQAFANRTDRRFRDVSFGADMSAANTFRSLSTFVGERVGVEYQGDLKLDAFGKLTFGAKLERETADGFSEEVQPIAVPRERTLTAEQVTRSGYALWQVPIGDRLDVSIGGRVDDVADVDQFATWRATGAYRIPETGTKLRSSVGTGGKAPSLFQLFAPFFGNANLSSERSFGVDGGIDQSLFGSRLVLSATGFFNTFDNLIDFDLVTFRYFNVARAETSGLELAADLELWPSYLRLKGVYTFLQSQDLDTGLTLARRPEHVGKLSLVITPTPKWTIEPVLYLISSRFSSANEIGRLAPYARLDIYSDYRFDQTWSAYVRLENLNNARYQEARNFGTTGPAGYVGMRATW